MQAPTVNSSAVPHTVLKIPSNAITPRTAPAIQTPVPMRASLIEATAYRPTSPPKRRSRAAKARTAAWRCSLRNSGHNTSVT